MCGSALPSLARSLALILSSLARRLARSADVALPSSSAPDTDAAVSEAVLGADRALRRVACGDCAIDALEPPRAFFFAHGLDELRALRDAVAARAARIAAWREAVDGVRAATAAVAPAARPAVCDVLKLIEEGSACGYDVRGADALDDLAAATRETQRWNARAVALTQRVTAAGGATVAPAAAAAPERAARRAPAAAAVATAAAITAAITAPRSGPVTYDDLVAHIKAVDALPLRTNVKALTALALALRGALAARVAVRAMLLVGGGALASRDDVDLVARCDALLADGPDATRTAMITAADPALAAPTTPPLTPPRAAGAGASGGVWRGARWAVPVGQKGLELIDAAERAARAAGLELPERELLAAARDAVAPRRAARSASSAAATAEPSPTPTRKRGAVASVDEAASRQVIARRDAAACTASSARARRVPGPTTVRVRFGGERRLLGVVPSAQPPREL